MIRSATIKDVSRIAEIQTASWRAAYRGMIPESYLQGLRVEQRERTWRRFVDDPDSPLLVTIQADEITGFCHISPSRDSDSDGVAEIIAIYVDPPQWRKGFGRTLCRSALSFAQERGFRAVTLWTLSENDSAHRFYEALGFRPDGASKVEAMPDFDLQEVRYGIHLNQNEQVGGDLRDQVFAQHPL